MFNDAVRFTKACPECAIVTGTGQRIKPPLHPIPVSRPFQILGIDVMDLPLTEKGNKHVVVIQNLFTKWSFVFAVSAQKTSRIARLLAEEVIPCFGVPESLLSDRGTHLLPNLMVDLCKMLGITKLNTTAYHPQCDGAVERFNRTLKTTLRKHAARFGCQWDNFLPGVLWAYRNTPHTSTGEKPSFLLYGVDWRSPTEAAYLPISEVLPTDVSDYREELMLSLSSARHAAFRRPKPSISINTTEAQGKPLYESGNGYSFTSRKMNQDDGGNYPDHGTALIESRTRLILMLLVLKYITHKKESYVFTSPEFVPAQKNSLLVITGMAARGRVRDVPRSGSINCCSLGPQSVELTKGSWMAELTSQGLRKVQKAGSR